MLEALGRQFIQLYPRKSTGLLAALLAFRDAAIGVHEKALEEGRDSSTPVDAGMYILSMGREYLRIHDRLSEEAKRFTPTAANWLNQGRYDWPEWQHKAQGGAARGNSRNTIPEPFDLEQLFAMSKSDTEAKANTIVPAYFKLRKHFEKIPEQAHTKTRPESLIDLIPEELCRAFEAAQREEFCPTAGVLWKFAQRDRDSIREELFAEHWRNFLTALKRHGADWKPAEFRVADGPADRPWEVPYEDRPAPVLDAEFEAALERAFGCDIHQARKLVYNEHPFFGQFESSNPALQAQQIEKRVRDVWMRMGRP